MESAEQVFTLDSPASDIATLLEHLASTHDYGDLYRGQTKEYPALMPSAYRSCMLSQTAHERIVGLDEAELMKQSARDASRWGMLNDLIGEMGLGLGNLLAQQYCLGSECIDVTEDLKIAAFFATRKYPEYTHFEQDGDIGVIYRFRNLGSRYHPRHRGGSIPLSAIDRWFAMGECNGQYFDSFVKEGEWGGTFERDHWFEVQPGTAAIVATLPLAISWTDILRSVRSEKAIMSLEEKARSYLKFSRRIALSAEWRMSRVARQRGGFIRPAYHFSALVPSRYRLASDAGQMARLYGGDPSAWAVEVDDLPWPRVVPSLALKRTPIGVENLRTYESCSAYYFRHGHKRIVGIYRRELWPEPNEDPLYGCLWQCALSHLEKQYRWPSIAPAVDDSQLGLLDRGYRLAGESQTMDGRDLEAQSECLLADAREAVGWGDRRSQHYMRMALALGERGDPRGAARASIAAVRCERSSVEALLCLSCSLQALRKLRWASLALRAAEVADPEYPTVLHALAVADIASGKYASAQGRLDKALTRFDPVIHKIPEDVLVVPRAIVAAILGEGDVLTTMCLRLTAAGVLSARELIAYEVSRLTDSRRS